MPVSFRDIVLGPAGSRVRRALGRFLVGTRAGATSIVTAAVAAMSVAGFAFITDHIWLIDQRDVLKSAADAAAIAATKEMNRRLVPTPDMSEADLTNALTPVARNYLELNLAYLPTDRRTRAKQTLQVNVTPNKDRGTVDVETTADLGGTLFSRHLPMLSNYKGPASVDTRAGVETRVTPVEAVLAIDVSTSMWSTLNPGTSSQGEKSRMAIVKDAAKALVTVLRPNEHNRVAIGVVPWHFNVRLADATATDWSDKRWARYPTKRTYGVPYGCADMNSEWDTCQPAAMDDELPQTAPEDWLGCLDGHRMVGSGTHAANASTSDFFSLPSISPLAQAYFPALYGSKYECFTLETYPSDVWWYRCYDLYDPNTWSGSIHEPQYGCSASGPTMLPLSTDRSAIIGAIDSLSAVGNSTHSGLGVLWGQRMLLSSWRTVWGGTIHPVDPASANGKGVRKVIVLLTDGEDTFCGSGNVTCADSRVGISRTEACAEAKKAGTEIFVVAAMHPDRVSTDLGTSLTECSSESDDSDETYAFLNNATPESLQAAFESIANQLRVVRRVH